MVAIATIRPQSFAGSPWAAKAMLGGYVVVLAMLTLVAFGYGSAYAQTNCDVRKSLIAKLDTGYDEQPIAVGLASTGDVVELLVSSDGTWTIMVTKPNGIACIAAAGEEWQELEAESLGESS